MFCPKCGSEIETVSSFEEMKAEADIEMYKCQKCHMLWEVKTFPDGKQLIGGKPIGKKYKRKVIE